MGENKRYKKSEKYKGVYQSKDGTWFYRYKRIFDEGGKPVYYQKGGFLTDKIAYEARMTAIQLGQATSKPKSDREETKFRTFGEYFNDFLENGTDSASSALKYKRLYTAQLKMWENRPVNKVSDADIENLLLGMTIFKETYIDPTDGKLKFRGYSESYLASFRKCLKQFFKYVHYKYGVVFGNRGQNVDTKPLKLKILSLFSGIGAPERACTTQRHYRFVKVDILHLLQFGAHQPRGSRCPRAVFNKANPAVSESLCLQMFQKLLHGRKQSSVIGGAG